jgi:hypothetical protein
MTAMADLLGSLGARSRFPAALVGLGRAKRRCRLWAPPRRMKIEGPKFRLWIDPCISVEERGEAAHAICRILVDPPRPVAERRRVAVRAALNLYSGSRSNRAEQLAARYRLYLSGAWPRKKSLESLPEPHSAEKTLLHRIARLNNGRPLCARQLLRICVDAPRKP